MSKSLNFAVILSGCGVYDGSEIHEAVTTLLALDEAGVDYQCFAPNIFQAKTIDHISGHSTALPGDDDNRHVLTESARIARGQIQDLKEFQVQEFDGIIFPGGMGVALNLSNAGTKGPKCDVQEDVKRVIEESYQNRLVIGAMCLAPTLIARVLGKHDITVTIGNDKQLGEGLKLMGAHAQICQATEVCIDEDNRIVTTPCYMLANSIKEVAQGTRNLVNAMIDLA